MYIKLRKVFVHTSLNHPVLLHYCNLLPKYCRVIIAIYFRRCQDIAVGFKFIFCFLSRYLEILTKSRAACSDRQTKESAVKYLSPKQNNVSSF